MLGDKRILRALSLLTACLFVRAVVAPPRVMAEDAQAPAQAAPGGLVITIVEGDDAIVNVRQRLNREAIVEVDDENHRPVAGAIVTFMAPENGPSATLLNGAKSIQAITGADGRTTLRGLTANKAQGKFEIRISASSEGRTGSATLHLTNGPPVPGASVSSGGGGLSAKAITLLVVAGAAAAGVAAGVLATRGGGSSPAPAIPSVGVSVGTPTVGPPH